MPTGIPENKAKEKWCPMVRCGSNSEDDAASNALVTDRSPHWSRCIGSACALWVELPNPSQPLEARGICGLSRELR